MERLLPRLGALLDELLLFLLGVFGWLSVRSVVQVVLLVFEDLFQPLDRMCVYGFVITVESGLPCCLLGVMECVSPLPGC